MFETFKKQNYLDGTKIAEVEDWIDEIVLYCLCVDLDQFF